MKVPVESTALLDNALHPRIQVVDVNGDATSAPPHDPSLKLKERVHLLDFARIQRLTRGLSPFEASSAEDTHRYEETIASMEVDTAGIMETNASDQGDSTKQLAPKLPDTMLQSLHQHLVVVYAETSVMLDVVKNALATARFLKQQGQPPEQPQWLHVETVAQPLPLPSEYVDAQRVRDLRYRYGARREQLINAARALRATATRLTTLVAREQQFLVEDALELRNSGWMFQARGDDLVINYGLSHQIDAVAVVQRDVQFQQDANGDTQLSARIQLTLPQEHRNDKSLRIGLHSDSSAQHVFRGERRTDSQESSAMVPPRVDSDLHPLHAQLLRAQHALFDQQVFREVVHEANRDKSFRCDVRPESIRLHLDHQHVTIELASSGTSTVWTQGRWCALTIILLRYGYLMKRRFYERQLRRTLFPVDMVEVGAEEEEAVTVLQPVCHRLLFWKRAEQVLKALNDLVHERMALVRIACDKKWQQSRLTVRLSSSLLTADITVDHERITLSSVASVDCVSAEVLCTALVQLAHDRIRAITDGSVHVHHGCLVVSKDGVSLDMSGYAEYDPSHVSQVHPWFQTLATGTSEQRLHVMRVNLRESGMSIVDWLAAQ